MENETPAPAKLRNIYMYRMVNGVKTRWKFEVDKDMVIVGEGPAEPVPASIQKPVEDEQSGISAEQAKTIASYKKVLDSRGISYDITERGQLIIKNVPDHEKTIQQFMDFNAETSPELEALKQAYKDEYNTLGGAACTGCQLGGLQRKYREKVQAILNANKAQTPVESA